MTRIGTLGNWFAKPPVTGGWAIFWAVAAVAAPTLIRASLDGIVVGVAVTPYVPFVLLAAIFLGWRHAAFVALASALIADAAFIGPPRQFLEGPTDIVALGFFLLASAMIIAFVNEIRSELSERHGSASSTEGPGGIVFSLEGGQAWASWYGSGPAIRLGPQEEVAKMMEDFLAQIELAKYLTQKAS